MAPDDRSSKYNKTLAELEDAARIKPEDQVEMTAVDQAPEPELGLPQRDLPRLAGGH